MVQISSYKSVKTYSPFFVLGVSDKFQERPGLEPLYKKLEFFAGPNFVLGTFDPTWNDRMGANFGLRYVISKNEKSAYYFQYKLDLLQFKYTTIEFDHAEPDIEIEVRSTFENNYIENSLGFGMMGKLDKSIYAFASGALAIVNNRDKDTNYDYEAFGLEVPTYELSVGFVATAGIRYNF